MMHRLKQLEFLAGIETDPTKLVLYDAKMESAKLEDEFYGPAQMDPKARDYLDHDNYDLACALECNDHTNIIEQIDTVAFELTGENEGAEWHWICAMKEAPLWAYIAGGCDYTGWF